MCYMNVLFFLFGTISKVTVALIELIFRSFALSSGAAVLSMKLCFIDETDKKIRERCHDFARSLFSYALHSSEKKSARPVVRAEA